MPVSIVDYENLIKDPLSLGMFRNLYRMSDIVKLFPVTEVGTLVVNGQEWSTLPTASFRDLNEQFTDSTGKTGPVEERLAILGGSFKADKVFKKLRNQLYRDPVQQQFDMYNKTIERTLADHLINGDIDADPKSFNGLYKRMGLDFPSSQIVSASGSTASLDVLTDATTAKKFFKQLDLAMYRAGMWGASTEGTPKGVLLMNETTFLGIQEAAKLTGYSIDQIDLLGFTWRAYKGTPFIDVGKKVDKTTEIILDTYDPGDAGNDCSRIYCVRFAPPDGKIDSPGADGLSLVQVGGYETLGPEDYAEYQRWAVQWVLGICHIGDNYCASVLEDFAMK